MLDWEAWMDAKQLHQHGHSIREIAALTGHSRNTIRKIQRHDGKTVPAPFRKPSRASKLDPFKPYLEARYRQCGLNALRLCEEIRAQGYDGSPDLVQRFIRTLKPDKVHKSRLTVRFETPPGQQMQADWAFCGRFPIPSGRHLSIYAFVAVLGFSRQRFVCFTTSMQTQHLLQSLEESFHFFGGVPQQVLFDNMKQVKLDAFTWNPLLLDFASHYGFVPQTCAPRRPRTKGKVERLVGFVKDGFLNGRSFYDLDDLNSQARAWLDIVNARPHGTTGVPPHHLWHTHEQNALASLDGILSYPLILVVGRIVDWNAMVCFERSRYSVPPRFAGHRVTVEHLGTSITIKRGELIVAQHTLAPRSGSAIVQEDHLHQLSQLTLQRPPTPCSPLLAWQLEFGPLNHQIQRVELSEFDSLVSSTSKGGDS